MKRIVADPENSKKLNRTRFERMTFWTGIRRATAAPPVLVLVALCYSLKPLTGIILHAIMLLALSIRTSCHGRSSPANPQRSQSQFQLLVKSSPSYLVSIPAFRISSPLFAATTIATRPVHHPINHQPPHRALHRAPLDLLVLVARPAPIAFLPPHADRRLRRVRGLPRHVGPAAAARRRAGLRCSGRSSRRPWAATAGAARSSTAPRGCGAVAVAAVAAADGAAVGRGGVGVVVLFAVVGAGAFRGRRGRGPVPRGLSSL
ncbi:uncharacterized protein PG998_006633 [Apiospora kogelbergensis]|uniref:uncharacterized protein n=1 Tax=Apiospora kogelbergensis TaxID=1337665 RepID=UPI00312D0664